MERLRKSLFFLLLLFLPTQLGRHFWPDWTQVLGLRIDYLSPTIYLTDLLLFLVFLCTLPQTPSFIKKFKKPALWFWAVIFFLSVLILGIIRSQNPASGFYQLVKWLELGFLFFYVVKAVHLREERKKIFLVLSLGLIFESSLVLAQFLNQGSIGGPLWWLGERAFTGQTLGVAQAAINGELLVRPYGTFSHPNVLAGYLVVIMALIMGISWQKRWAKLIIKWLAIVLGISALFFTFSRSGWIVGFLVILFWLVTQRKWLPFLLAVFLVITTFGSVQSRLQTLLTSDQESWQRRQELNSAAVEMIKKQPLFGVGLGNFLIQLPQFHEERQAVRFLQPAHNFYLMVAAETGLIILSAFLTLVFFTYKKLLSSPRSFSSPLLIAFSALLLLSLVDHYFYTLQQGQLLMALIFGLSWSSFGQKGIPNS